MKTEMISLTNGKELALYTWDQVTSPIAVLQLVHGMCEHCARYDDFARYCNQCGVIVACTDLRGHGKSAGDTYGFEPGDMWEDNVSDQIMLSRTLSEKYNLPLVLMGHSYGSFLTQRLITTDPYPSCFILSGSSYMKSMLYTMGRLISCMARKLKGGDKPCKIMADMSFKGYEKRIPGTNNWLTRDQKVVQAYNDDPACGYVASNNFYATFMTGIKGLYTKQATDALDGTKPIYIFSGANDPVGEYGKGVRALYDYYKKNGCDVLLRLYPDGRHEMLNELNKEQVYSDVLSFIREHLSAE